MKNKHILIFAGFLAFIFSGCNSYLDKLDNPNLVINPPLNGLLATATSQTGLDVFRMGNAVSYYSQYLASNTKGSGADTYDEVDYSGTWSYFYSCMMNIKQMNDLAVTEDAYYHLGIGKILMAFNLNMLINTFGDVPYSTAFMGKEVVTPTYDPQETLHATCLQLIDEGIADLQRNDVTVVLDASSDVIHKGNTANWIRTAYGLKARFLNQLSKTSTYDPAAVLTAVASSYDGSNPDTQDATLTAFDGLSPWNQVAYNNTQLNLDGWLSSQFVDALNGTTYGIFDPRLPKIATLTKFGDYRGTPNGAGRIGTGTNQEESYLGVDGFYSKSGAPVQLFTYAELKFIEAEAAFRSNNKSKAYLAYLDGIKAHMNKLGVSSVDQLAYINNPAVSVGEAGLTLDLIFKEKYVAMFLNPESWVDARRYDYKYSDFTIPEGAVLSTFIRRLGYPTVETSRNGANVPIVSGLDQRLYWDK
ncbi:hypothetical protein ADIARSV_0368 [Arcticibacter svalbardensis MN12-7]|uniref:SusD/RagB family nutrient-binding outer membrane lipoprotein n=1 Tax=Arcticibacter svalbardensis MN12-7 TaxID=1150600 RepID=R9GY78_9SPHI|nr:SusD/RagB family nutrient-binding outer membrane lipoprotein [Arcticibacter svalbardensis]EOR96465.1 hypothetical protein ADIARSV_0368 [Arcticibacter svalbardensis MN12-7]